MKSQTGRQHYNSKVSCSILVFTQLGKTQSLKPELFKNIFFITLTLKDHDMFMLLSISAQCQWIKWITGLSVLVHYQILNYQSGFIFLFPYVFCKNILETQKCILFKMILALTVSFTSPKGPFGFALCER